jgi:predicted DNA-binding transcriptional regulator AlpA
VKIKKRVRAALNKKHCKQQVAPDNGRDQHDRLHVAGSPTGVRLLDKAEILAITGVTFPTIWAWMRAGKFPRSYVIGGGSSKSVWRSDQIDAWIAGLPVRRLKGDARS